MWNGKQVGPTATTPEDGKIYQIPEAEALMFGDKVFKPVSAQSAPVTHQGPPKATVTPDGSNTSPEIEEAKKVPKTQ